MNDKIITGMLIAAIVGLLLLALTLHNSLWEDLGRRVVEQGVIR